MGWHDRDRRWLYGNLYLDPDAEIKREYEIRLENLTAQKEEEEQRALDLEEERKYVQTKEYIKEVAKEKLGLVDPDEILLKPANVD